MVFLMVLMRFVWDAHWYSSSGVIVPLLAAVRPK